MPKNYWTEIWAVRGQGLANVYDSELDVIRDHDRWQRRALLLRMHRSELEVLHRECVFPSRSIMEQAPTSRCYAPPLLNEEVIVDRHAFEASCGAWSRDWVIRWMRLAVFLHRIDRAESWGGSLSFGPQPGVPNGDWMQELFGSVIDAAGLPCPGGGRVRFLGEVCQVVSAELSRGRIEDIRTDRLVLQYFLQRLQPRDGFDPRSFHDEMALVMGVRPRIAATGAPRKALLAALYLSRIDEEVSSVECIASKPEIERVHRKIGERLDKGDEVLESLYPERRAALRGAATWGRYLRKALKEQREWGENPDVAQLSDDELGLDWKS